MARSLARYGIDESTRAPLSAAGWIDGESVVAAAVPLLEESRKGPDPVGALPRLAAVLEADPELGRAALDNAFLGRALVAIAGASPALSRIATANPKALLSAADGPPARRHIDLPQDRVGQLRAIRHEVSGRLLGIAAHDLAGSIPMPDVARHLSDLADDAAAAAIAAVVHDPRLERLDPVPFSVIAMGKWGGRELNYASDIDVLFVYEATDEHGRPAESAQRTAESFLDALATPTADGLAFRVDAGLRPEGTSGPLARTLDSYRTYWDRWADTWELQALIKARVAAGDRELGNAFLNAAEPFVYPETLGADAIHEVRSLKARAEALAERQDAIEIKRGVGGIRDAEFAVQLLQLVHGRSDPDLRSANTLEALAVLRRSGYVRPDDAAALEEAYRWLRDVEHRLQMVDLRQTHQLPADSAERDRIAKSMGFRDDAEATALERFEAKLIERRAAIRTIHERLFYRPLLEAYAESPAVRLTPEGAARQLAALGFTDLEGAKRAFADLTSGLSRRSRLMQQLLPLMMDWLSQAPNPDLGLAQLRLLVTSTPDNAVLISAMRDNPVAAERLCTLLGTGKLLGRLLDRIPPSLSRLGDDEALAAFPSHEALDAEAERRLSLHAGRDNAPEALRRFAEAHLLWIASRDLIGQIDETLIGQHLSHLADASVQAALSSATRLLRDDGLKPPPMAIIAFGKWGGRELNYGSDLDAMAVFRSGAENDAETAARAVESLLAILNPGATVWPGLTLDLDLRPEGRKGPIARSIESFVTYWARWADTWELQALLRARPAAGDPDLGAEFVAAAQDRLFGDGPTRESERDIRQMKARVEQERISPDEDPEYHMKLGRGGMADVEWLVQLLQLRHGAAALPLRTASTLAGLHALGDADLISPEQAQILEASYRFCARVRNRLFLQAGRPRDSLPADPAEVTRLARSLSYARHPRTTLREEYRRLTRRARRVFEALFYEQ
jgi:glutamate-ammonia-ligase adenylyltransferase